MLAALIAGCAAGAVHVLAGPDHLAAVAPLAADRDGAPWRSGYSWGLGHAGGVLLVGLGALLLREVLPVERLSSWSERLVGLVLIGIGTWGLVRARRQKVHSHAHRHGEVRHEHLHVHDVRTESPHVHDGPTGPHRHAAPEGGIHVHPAAPRAAFAVGVLHGLAGSAHFLGVLPALALPTRAAAVGYVVAFGAGTVAAMTGFAAVIGGLVGRSARRGTAVYRGLLSLLSVAAIGVGLVWMLG
ncbi:MAG: High-affinity nickel transporter [Gemmatimonadota bacterium]|nr:High-affinity nickel transporter [Gemmatimonadota bacterium]